MEKKLKFSEFFKLFIAVHLMKGNDYLNIDSFKKFLKRHYKEYSDFSSSLSKTINGLVASKLVTYDFENENVLFASKKGIMTLVDGHGYNLDQIYKVASAYDQYCKAETARAYDMMIEPEAIRQYNMDIDRRIQEEISAYAKYGPTK